MQGNLSIGVSWRMTHLGPLVGGLLFMSDIDWGRFCPSIGSSWLRLLALILLLRVFLFLSGVLAIKGALVNIGPGQCSKIKGSAPDECIHPILTLVFFVRFFEVFLTAPSSSSCSYSL